MWFEMSELRKIEFIPDETEEKRNEIELCKRFINLYCTPSSTYCKKATSYRLKHVVENWLIACHNLGIDIKTYNPRYISNDAFIAAMDELFYESKREYKGSPNYYFKFRYVGPKTCKSYLNRYVMPYSEEQWKSVLDVIGD